jgi:trehalose 6-phosphate phosphatase
MTDKEGTAMRHLFGTDGEAALAAALRQRPLLAFDFDGTLAPIVARAEDARLSTAVSARLKALAAQLPLAIVTGRTVSDVRSRLGFEPQFLLGNHGAEDLHNPEAVAVFVERLNGLRRRLQARQAELTAAGIVVEDKGASVALHYRLSRQRAEAQALIEKVLQPGDAAWHVFGGKMVVNVAARDAPDKAAAVFDLVARCGARCAVFAGDDVNDEPVFAAAPPHWLTIRIGRGDGRSRARYFLDSPNEMAMLLERMLMLLPTIHVE